MTLSNLSLLIFYPLSSLPFPIRTYVAPIPFLLAPSFRDGNNTLHSIIHFLFSPCFLASFLYCKLHIYLTLSFRFTLQSFLSCPYCIKHSSVFPFLSCS